MVGIARQELTQLIPRVNIEAYALERYIVRGAVMEVEGCANATQPASSARTADKSPENMDTEPGASPASEQVRIWAC